MSDHIHEFGFEEQMETLSLPAVGIIEIEVSGAGGGGGFGESSNETPGEGGDGGYIFGVVDIADLPSNELEVWVGEGGAGGTDGEQPPEAWGRSNGGAAVTPDDISPYNTGGGGGGSTEIVCDGELLAAADAGGGGGGAPTFVFDSGTGGGGGARGGNGGNGTVSSHDGESAGGSGSGGDGGDAGEIDGADATSGGDGGGEVGSLLSETSTETGGGNSGGVYEGPAGISGSDGSVTITIYEPPEPPEAVGATELEDEIDLEWSEPSSGGFIENYRIYRDTGDTSGSPDVEVDGSETSATDTDRLNGRTYEYIVSSWNPAGEAAAAPITATTLIPPVENLAVENVDGRHATVSWTDPSTNTDHYEVLVREDGDGDWVTDDSDVAAVGEGESVTYQTTELLDGQLYELTVETHTEDSSVREADA